MEHVVLVIHLILALAIIGLVLLQRSEGGGLGIGTGGGLGGLATAGQTANALTKATAFCAACFFVTSLILGVLAGAQGKGGGSLLDQLDNAPPAQTRTMNKNAEEKKAPAKEQGSKAPATPEPEDRPSVPVE